MKNVFLLTALGLLFSCLSLLGQDADSASNRASVADPSTTQSEGQHGIYVSGFRILNEEKNITDLGDYPSRILTQVRGKWYPQILQLQKSIGRKRGTAVIEFEIRRDGSLVRTTTVESAGDPLLDAAAAEAISSSQPFARFPEAYQEKALNLRMNFGYDQPAIKEAPFCNGPNWGAHSAAYPVGRVGNGATPPKPTHTPNPDYSEQARREKYMSIVKVAGTADRQGAFTDICLAEAAGAGLDEKAFEAVRTWKFEPATKEGQPVAVRLVVEMSFRLY